MGAETEISWTNATFNPWWGCVRVSPGCTNCYAESFAKRTGNQVWGVQAPRRFFGEKHWREPLKWNATAEKARIRKRVFCASMADVFEDRDDLLPWRMKLWSLIESTPWLDWQLLTKRPENIRDRLPMYWAPRDGTPRVPRNLWLGTTAEDQKHYNERWPELAAVARDFGVATTFISYEPALGPLELRCRGCDGTVADHHAPDQGGCSGWFPSWVIVGGESGPGARVFEVDWARSVVEQCASARIACWVKQMGRNPALSVEATGNFRTNDKTGRRQAQFSVRRLPLLDKLKGADPSEWPPELRVRQFPEARP